MKVVVVVDASEILFERKNLDVINKTDTGQLAIVDADTNKAVAVFNKWDFWYFSPKKQL